MITITIHTSCVIVRKLCNFPDTLKQMNDSSQPFAPSRLRSTHSTLFPLSLLKRRKKNKESPLSIIIGESPVLHAVYRWRCSSNLHLFFSIETVPFLLTRWQCSRNFITVRFFLVILLSDDSESLMLGSSGKHTAYYSTCRAADFFLFPLLYR